MTVQHKHIENLAVLGDLPQILKKVMLLVWNLVVTHEKKEVLGLVNST